MHAAKLIIIILEGLLASRLYTYISTKVCYHMVAIYFIICNALKQMFIQICSVHACDTLHYDTNYSLIQVHTVVVAHNYMQ